MILEDCLLVYTSMAGPTIYLECLRWCRGEPCRPLETAAVGSYRWWTQTLGTGVIQGSRGKWVISLFPQEQSCICPHLYYGDLFYLGSTSLLPITSSPTLYVSSLPDGFSLLRTCPSQGPSGLLSTPWEAFLHLASAPTTWLIFSSHFQFIILKENGLR